jgi:hypothetical protein
MKQNRHQVTRNSSPATTRLQVKKRESKAGSPVAPSQASRSFAPFNMKEDNLSCLCVFDRVAGGAASLIPLNSDEYGAAILESARLDTPFERWIADAIREKLCRSRGESSSASTSQSRIQRRSGSGVSLLPMPESEAVSKLKYAILTIPLAEPGKLPTKADEAVVELASRLGCDVNLTQVRQQVRRLANGPNPLIRRDGSRWKLTEAGKKEHMELFIADCSSRRAAERHAIQQDQARRLAAGTVTCVWTCPDGSEWARVEFERELFSRIEYAASKLGVTLQQFFEKAIRHHIDSHHDRRAA